MNAGNNAISRRVAMADGLRTMSSAIDTGRKEWTHFCVFGGRANPQLIVNFSLSDGVQGRGSGNVARLVVMSATGESWCGSVERFDPNQTEFTEGAINLAFGDNRLEFVDGAYLLNIRTAQIGMQLRCLPRLSPVIPANTRLGAGFVRWMIAPLLVASGTVRVGQRTYQLENVPAYHDHNWGRFRWGDNFGWEWAIALDDDPFADRAIVLSRVYDPRRASYLSNVLLVWDGDRIHDFRGPWLTSESNGWLAEGPRLRIPGPLDLLLEGYCADIPRSLTLSGKNRHNEISVSLRPGAYGQIGIPNDDGGYGISLLTEAHARACASGTLNGRRFRLDGPAVFEIAGSAA